MKRIGCLLCCCYIYTFSFSQSVFREIHLTPRFLGLTDISAPWSDKESDNPEDSVYNKLEAEASFYKIVVVKDSISVEVYAITKYFHNVAYQNHLSVDSICRPVRLEALRGDGEGGKDEKAASMLYTYKWQWANDNNNKLMYIEEYYRGKFKRRIYINKSKRKK